MRAWICWDASGIRRGSDAGQHAAEVGEADPVPWLTETVSVPWLALMPGTSAPAEGTPNLVDFPDIYRAVQALAWVLIEDGVSAWTRAAS